MHIYELSYQSDYIHLGHDSAHQDVIGDRTSHARLMDFLIKKLKHCRVNVNYKNISYYVLFVFIILTCSISHIRPL